MTFPRASNPRLMFTPEGKKHDKRMVINLDISSKFSCNRVRCDSINPFECKSAVSSQVISSKVS